MVGSGQDQTGKFEWIRNDAARDAYLNVNNTSEIENFLHGDSTYEPESLNNTLEFN